MNGTTVVVLTAILCITGLSYAHYRSMAGIAESLAEVIRDSYAPADLPESRPSSVDLETDDIGYGIDFPGHIPRIVDPTEVEFPTPAHDGSHLLPHGMDVQAFLGIGDSEVGPVIPNPTDFAGIDLGGELT